MITKSSKKSSRKETVFLFNSKVKLFDEGKLRSKWKGPYTVVNTSSHGVITIQDDEGNAFKVNGQRLKVFLEPTYNPKEKIDVIKLIAFNKFPNSK